MKRIIWTAAMAFVAAAGFSLSQAAEPDGSSDVSIPFANHGGIRDWRADRDRGLWLQDAHGKWYYATVMSPCIGLNFANSIGFDTRPMGSFDKFSAIVVPRSGRCTIQSLRPSGAPPSKRNKAQIEEAQPRD